MSANLKTRPARRSDRGYALLLVMFFVALLVLATAAAAPNIITSGRRDQEEEMIWRGNQYVRGIRLFYMKQHRFPTQLEDLYKPKTGIRFMRQAYKDPVNPTGGEWRLIYVGPNGMLIGSTKNRTLNLPGQTTPASGSPTASSANGFGSASNLQSSSSPFGQASSLGASFNSQNPPAGNAANAQVPDNGPNSTDDSGQLEEPTFTDTSGIIGGNIIGVGSKVNKRSIKWYQKAHNYRQFEFVWDPSVDALTGQSLSMPVNNSGSGLSPSGLASNPGSSPASASPGGPPLTAPNPSPPTQAPQN